MEKQMNSSNGYEFNATSPQQILDKNATSTTIITNNSAYNEVSGGIYNNNNNNNGLFPASMSEQQRQSSMDINNGVVENDQWIEYKDDSATTTTSTTEILTQNDIMPLDLSTTNESNFHNLYGDSFNFQTSQEQAFDYTQHRGSLPIIHHSTPDLFNPPPSMENISATTAIHNFNNDMNNNNNNQAPYMRRYTEGAIPKYGGLSHNGGSGRKQRINSSGSSNSNSNSSSSRGDVEDLLNTEEGKRKHFLERNRQAALKCRQRKKQWLANLQHRVEFLSTDNEQLQSQATLLREEVINLKTLLLAHRDCKVAQSNGTTMSMIQNASSLSSQFTTTNNTAAASSNNNNTQQFQTD